MVGKGRLHEYIPCHVLDDGAIDLGFVWLSRHWPMMPLILIKFLIIRPVSFIFSPLSSVRVVEAAVVDRWAGMWVNTLFDH